MSRFRRTAIKALLPLALTCGLLAAPSTASAAPTSAPVAASAALSASLQTTASLDRKKSNKYRVRPGVTFNSPLAGKKASRSIIAKINSAISHTRKGQEIRIFSWKVWTRAGVTALLNAQKRGVRVRVIMDKKNTIVEKNPHFWRLKAGLKAGNKHRKPSRRSGARLCDHSCRGSGGAAHSKFMLFSKSGTSKWVYMSSSANWGDAAANLQWNDMYTFVGAKDIYGVGVKVFDEAWKDKPAKRRWTEYTTPDGKNVVAWAPTTASSRRNDRLLNTLKQVRCKGATGGAGNANGRTVIRTAPDVIRGERGMAVGRQLRRLWVAGCDVKIGYTVMGKDVFRMLTAPSRRGPVPINHLTQDFDGDGVFDRYFHLKVYTINGVIGSKRNASWMVMGSSNTSKLAQISDEQFVYFIDRPGITRRYQNHINYWFDHFPSSARLSARVAGRVAAGAIDPYAKMEMD